MELVNKSAKAMLPQIALAAVVAVASGSVQAANGSDANPPCNASAAEEMPLAKGFVSPPDSARPHVYYMIMNGNMSKECITADFEAMAKTGIGGVLVLDVGCFIPAGPIVFASPEWYDIMLHLHKEAKRLGIEVTLPNCAGWSSSGGPWLTAEHAMKRVVCTETPAKGPRRFSAVLPRTKKDNGFYEDIAVFAYPTPEKGAALTDLKAKIGAEHKSFKRDDDGALGITRPTKDAMPMVGRLVPKPPSGALGITRPTTMIAKDKIIDLTAKMSKDGKLEWDVPAGNWTILRIGYACNGRCNHPASNGGRGFEVDKLSAKAMDIHFEALIGRLCRHLGVSAATDNSTGFNAAHIDSYEVDCQNWTQGLDKTFEKRMGYSITPYLPVFAGRIVESIDETERFLEDFRRLLADLFAENYAGRFTELCHKYGLKSSLEPYGNSNADNLQYGQSIDVPMTEFWSSVKYGDHHVGGIGNTIAASLAHVWGRRYAGAEAFTAAPQNGGRWRTTPFSIKAQGDRVFAAGVNRIVYHRYACQPWPGNKYLPAMTMGRWGIHLERTQTWWPLASDWFRYQSRCQWMLQEGRFAADVLCWCGEDAPNGSQQNFRIPKGYKHDLCATKTIELLKVRNGKLVVPGGVEYEVLVLPNVDTMSERMVNRIGELLDAGAKVVSPRRPVRAPGYGRAGRPRPADAAHGRAVAPRPPSDGTGCRPYQTLVDSVWAKGVIECGVAEALARLGIQPDFTTDAEDVSWIHRRGDNDADWYFVAQDNEVDSTFEASFRENGRQPEIWDALTGEIRPANVWREENGRTIVTLDFPPSGSAFVVFRNRITGKHIVKAEVSVAKPEKTTERPKKKHTLVIKKAEYGLFPGMEIPPGGHSPKWRIDVTKVLAAHVKDGASINLDVGYSLFKRDPAFRFHKITRIEYEYDGVTYTTDRGEGARFRVPDDFSIQPPEWEWRDGEVLAWKPLTAKLQGSDGVERTISANPPEAIEVTGEWDVSFPPGWDAPALAVFPKLVPWNTSADWGIKYFSGTATYRKSWNVEKCESGKSQVESREQDVVTWNPRHRIMLDLGDVKNFAEVKVNGRAYPVLWKPPFRVDITDAVAAGRGLPALPGGCSDGGASRPRRADDAASGRACRPATAAGVLDIEIKVTNLWPNRLIGDDVLCKPDCEWTVLGRRGMPEYAIKEIPQWVKDGKPSPTGRRTFTTWKHWSKDDKLLPSGLIGPVVIRFGEMAE